MAYYERWKPYVSVATRRARAQKKMEALRKKGVDIQPIEIAGRKIATTFWGEAWCDHLESFSDYANRLPRGRTYVRNGSVCHLGIKEGKIEAKVSGSDIYEIRVNIKTLPNREWNAIKKRCSGQIGSLLELLKGDLSGNIMQVVTDRKNGLFPKPAEISFDCDCPDWATMCKHIAAVLYGVGARLDEDPALLFTLRGVNHEELIDVDSQVAVPTGTGRGGAKRLASGDLGDVFGIDLEPDVSTASQSESSQPNGEARPTKKKKKSAATKKKTSASKKTASTSRKKTAATKKTVSSVRKKSSQRSLKNVAEKAAATKSGDAPKKKTRQPTRKKKTARKPRAAAANNAGRGSSKKKAARKPRRTSASTN